MKGFLLFLVFTFIVIGAIGYYEMQHPDEIKVRKDGRWTTLHRIDDTATKKSSELPEK